MADIDTINECVAAVGKGCLWIMLLWALLAIPEMYLVHWLTTL